MPMKRARVSLSRIACRALPNGEQGELGGGDADAVGAAGHPEELESEAPQHLRQRQREDAEEDARVTHAYEAEQRRHHESAEQSAEDAHFHRFRTEVAHDERHRVGAGAEIGGMAEGEQARVAKQQVEAERGDGHDQTVGEQHRLVGVDDPWQHRQYDEDDGGRHADPPCRGPGAHTGRHRGGDVGAHAHALPNRPVGRTSKTAVAIR
jgi:hypothetical protein